MNKSGLAGWALSAWPVSSCEGRAPSEIVRCAISQLSGAGINLRPGIAQNG